MLINATETCEDKMAKALPRKYFPGYTARIYYRKVDKWATMLKEPYFDTWEEAHNHMLEKAKCEVTNAEKALAAAKRHLKRVEAMKEPESNNEAPK
jgi:hypothetical protein